MMIPKIKNLCDAVDAAKQRRNHLPNDTARIAAENALDAYARDLMTLIIGSPDQEKRIECSIELSYYNAWANLGQE